MSEVVVETYWARRKLDRARAHLAELEHVARDWLQSEDHLLEIVPTDDGHGLRAVLELVDPPCLDDWSLIVGDCVHNMRTALDVFVWANSRTLPEKELRKVAYPILPRDLRDPGDDDDLEELSDELEDQPSSVQKRIREQVAGLPELLQSRVLENIRWSASLDEGSLYWGQPLPLIQEIDNTDKHRLALELVSSQATAMWAVKMWGESGERLRAKPVWEGGDLTPAVLGERIVIATVTTSSPIARWSGRATVSFWLRMRVLDLTLAVFDTLGDFIEHVDGLLEVLADPRPTLFRRFDGTW